MRARDIKLNRYYLLEDAVKSVGGRILFRCLFKTIQGPEKDPWIRSKFLCHILATTLDDFDEELYDFILEKTRLVRPVPVNELPLFIDLPHKTIHYEEALRCPSSSNPMAPPKNSPTP